MPSHDLLQRLIIEESAELVCRSTLPWFCSLGCFFGSFRLLRVLRVSERCLQVLFDAWVGLSRYLDFPLEARA